MSDSRIVAVIVITLLITACATLPAPDRPANGPANAPASRTGDAPLISGLVFADTDGNGRHDTGESGIGGVLVSNGLDVIRSDARGRYALPLRPDMDLTIVQPAGWQAPLDERGVPKIGFSHKTGGSPEPLRFGGLPDTGSAPRRVDFALRKTGNENNFRCAIIGDSQTYSNDEIGYFRDSAIRDLVNTQPAIERCMIYLGDVVGDDLGLLNRLLEVGASVGAPQWLVFGNHDLDFDATHPDQSSDSWRRMAMPSYYAFEIGQVTFITLNNVVYPCGSVDSRRPGREFCLEDAPRYNGRVPETQMVWLSKLLAHIPEDRLIVLLHHIPLVSFSDAQRPAHQTDNAAELHALLAGRPALSLSGHTHTLENLDPGEWFEGWREHTGVGPLPFRHIVAGAASGAWWLGDLDVGAIPMALQRLGAPKGVMLLDFEGTQYRESYRASSIDPDRIQWTSFNTPDYRRWYAAIAEWLNTDPDSRDPVPPQSLHDLPDTQLFTRSDLEQGVHLAVNVWLGSASTQVEARINGGRPLRLNRTQAGRGEAANRGVMFADPFATRRQLSMARSAVRSSSGDERAQGFEAFRGSRYQGVPRPQPRDIPARNIHLWQVRLPADLPYGVHQLTVNTTDRHGRSYAETTLFEVRSERPPRYWRGGFDD